MYSFVVKVFPDILFPDTQKQPATISKINSRISGTIEIIHLNICNPTISMRNLRHLSKIENKKQPPF